MHRTGVNGRGRFHFIRLLFHRVGRFLHLVRGLFHCISDSFLIWLSDRAVLHPFVALHLAALFHLARLLHLHALILHPLHPPVLHSLMLHALATFRRALGLTEFFFDGERRFITREEIARSSCMTSNLWIGGIPRRKRWRICCAACPES